MSQTSMKNEAQNPSTTPSLDRAPAEERSPDAEVSHIELLCCWVAPPLESLRKDKKGSEKGKTAPSSKVLTGLGKRIDRSATWIAPPAPDAVDAFFESLSA